MIQLPRELWAMIFRWKRFFHFLEIRATLHKNFLISEKCQFYFHGSQAYHTRIGSHEFTMQVHDFAEMQLIALYHYCTFGDKIPRNLTIEKFNRNKLTNKK